MRLSHSSYILTIFALGRLTTHNQLASSRQSSSKTTHRNKVSLHWCLSLAIIEERANMALFFKEHLAALLFLKTHALVLVVHSIMCSSNQYSQTSPTSNSSQERPTELPAINGVIHNSDGQGRNDRPIDASENPSRGARLSEYLSTTLVSVEDQRRWDANSDRTSDR